MNCTSNQALQTRLHPVVGLVQPHDIQSVYSPLVQELRQSSTQSTLHAGIVRNTRYACMKEPLVVAPKTARRFKALVADDDDIVTRYLSASLRSSGWTVVTARNGVEALDVYEKERPDLVILDLMMPTLNGFETCRMLRERSQVPIIVLSVRNDPSDKVRALNLGADDYLTKPFAIEELKARMTSVLRRVRAGAESPRDAQRIVGDLTVDSVSHVVHHSGISARLTPTEHALLDEFIENVGKVLTHAYLLNRVWGPSHSYDKEYVHVFVNRLRAKLEADPHNPRLIRTVQGVGYVFRTSEEYTQ